MPSNLSAELMHQWTASQAESRPDAAALVMSHERMTYRQLEARSNQLARLLVEGGCQRGDRVAVLLPKSPLAIVAFLGILKADCIYVPLDASSPPQRLANMLARCEPRWVLASASQEAILRETLPHVKSQKPIPVGWMDVEPELDSEFAGF